MEWARLGVRLAVVMTAGVLVFGIGGRAATFGYALLGVGLVVQVAVLIALVLRGRFANRKAKPS